MRITFNVMTDESGSGIPAGNGNEKTMCNKQSGGFSSADTRTTRGYGCIREYFGGL